MKKLVLVLVVALILVLAIFQTSIRAFKIPTNSMSPTFLKDERIMISNAPYWKGQPARGDVIAFKSIDGSERLFVKRVIGLALLLQTLLVNGLLLQII